MSFEKWLRQFGVVGKLECPQRRGEPVINFLFKNLNEANKFRAKFQLKNSVFGNFNIGNEWSITIEKDEHDKIISEYRNQFPFFYSTAALQKQIDRIKYLIDLLDKKIGDGSSLGERLELLQGLATHKLKNGADPVETSSIFPLAWRCIRELDHDLYDDEERSQLDAAFNFDHPFDEMKITPGVIKYDTNDHSFLKYSFYGYEAVRANLANLSDDEWSQTEARYSNKIAGFLDQDARHHVDGVENRKVINRMTQRGELKAFDLETEKKDVEVRSIPRFMPTKDEKELQRRYVIRSGGMHGHYTMTEFMWEAVDEKDQPIQEGKKPHHYRYYMAIHNAGAGLVWKDRYNKVAWTSAVWELRPIWNEFKNTEKHNEAIRKQIMEIHKATRMICFYDEPYFEHNVGGVPVGFSKKDSAEAKKWGQYHKIIEDAKGELCIHKSRHGLAQETGNCILESPLNAVAGCVSNLHPRETMVKEFHLFVKKKGYWEIRFGLEAVLQRNEKLLGTEDEPGPAKQFQDQFLMTVLSGRHEKAFSMLNQNPGLVNFRFPIDGDYKNGEVPLLHALVEYADKEAEVKLIKRILESKVFNLNLSAKDHENNNVLHAIAKALKNSEIDAETKSNLQALAKQIQELNPKLVIEKNKFGQTPSDMGSEPAKIVSSVSQQSSPPEVKADKTVDDVIVCLEDEKSTEEERLEAALTILRKQPQLLNQQYQVKSDITTNLLVNAIFQAKHNSNEKYRNTYAEFFCRLLDDEALLKSSKVSLDQADSNRNTALHRTAWYAKEDEKASSEKEHVHGIFTKMALKLLQKGAVTYLRNDKGHTSLWESQWLLRYINPMAFSASLFWHNPQQRIHLVACAPAKLKEAFVPVQPTIVEVPLPVLPVIPDAPKAVIAKPVSALKAVSSASAGDIKLIPLNGKSKPSIFNSKEATFSAIKDEVKHSKYNRMGQKGCLFFTPGGIKDLRKAKTFEAMLRILRAKVPTDKPKPTNRDEDLHRAYKDWLNKCTHGS